MPLRLLVTTVLALVLAPAASAGGGSYVFDGGTTAERAQVRAALEASSFDWNLVTTTVTIHVRTGVATRSEPGHIWLDARLLRAGTFAWAIVQDEYAHQLDFARFDPATRAALNAELGGRDWCYGVSGLSHSDYGCERFASTLVWAYWPSEHNAYRPASRHDEAAAMAPAAFRALLARVLGGPS